MKTRRRRAGGEAFDWRRLPKIVLISLGAIFLGWLSVRAAVSEALARRNPAAAAAILPNDPGVAFTLATAEFRARQGPVSAATYDRVLAAFRKEPLAQEPFLFAALAELAGKNPAAAGPLIAEARRRHPRSRVGRLIYLDQVLRAGRVDEAASEIAVISRLVPEASRLLVPELARYAADPKTAPALIRALEPDPKIREQVLAHLAAKGEIDAVMRLAGTAPSSGARGETPEWQNLLLATLVEKGEIARARSLWSRFAGLGAEALSYGVYDGAFRRAPGPAPFNWRFSESGAGVAEPTKQPALQVDYYGRADAELASQLLQLAPGRHVLSLTVSGSSPKGGGVVSWTLACARSKTEVATFALSNLSYSPKRLNLPFDVPAGCPAQWLKLKGTTAELPAAHSIIISDLQVRRAS
ncbi:MAG TPA: hypothetical protein VF631_00105 [Allosphingosinicella sp.]|uniref:hypothetical protein n=1 Tax=Allosphingosinicella sp. TaxID=2823234 RepID=UPI002F299220